MNWNSRFLYLHCVDRTGVHCVITSIIIHSSIPVSSAMRFVRETACFHIFYGILSIFFVCRVDSSCDYRQHFPSPIPLLVSRLCSYFWIRLPNPPPLFLLSYAMLAYMSSAL